MSNIWEFFAGLGIFLFSMWLIEDALKQLAGRTFKLFLRKYTNNRFTAILSGVLVTTVLQSSSIATLMTLAFVAAGAISMRNAFAVVLGANIGTTLSSWIVAIIGFKFSLDSLSYPLMAIAAPGIVMMQHNRKIYNLSRFLFSFGMLFLGFEFMKDSMMTLLSDFDFTSYLHFDASVFVVVGFVITALMQSSSATMVIALSALNTGALPFETAAAVVIGSELGTAAKFYVGSPGRTALKNRITIGNIIFNAVITIGAYLLLPQLVSLVTSLPGIDSRLYSLVAFQTIINTVGVILFYPFLGAFDRLLGRMFRKEEISGTFFVRNAGTDFTEEAAALLRNEAYYFILRSLLLNMEAFHISRMALPLAREDDILLAEKDKKFKSYEDRYGNLKQAEGEILSFYLNLKSSKSGEHDEQSMNTIERMAASVRNAAYSAKGMKDIIHNRRELRASADDLMYGQYKFFKHQLTLFYEELGDVLMNASATGKEERLKQLYKRAADEYEHRLMVIYNLGEKGDIAEQDIASLLNVNRELYSSCKAIVRSVNDYFGFPLLTV